MRGKLKDLLPISKEKRIRLVIGIGYAAKEGLRPKKRKSLEEIATFGIVRGISYENGTADHPLCG